MSNLYCEITEDAFNAIRGNKEPYNYSELEQAVITDFISNGVNLRAVFNHVSSTRQFFVRDINA